MTNPAGHPQPAAQSPDPRAIHRVGEQYKLAIPRSPIAGVLGEMMGASSGSSLEFQDYREYVPGDDPRHIDWSAFARSDQLMVRLYREEVAPFADLLVDGSRSMAVGDGRKGKLVRELALAFELFARQAGADPVLWLVGDEARPLEGTAEAKLAHLALASRTSFERLADWRRTLALRRRSIRVVLSDFLFIHHPEELVKQLAAASSALWLIQVLARDEAQPTVGGGVRLVDAESGEFHDLILNDQTTSGYLRRLGNLQTGLARACRRAGARFVSVVADQSLDAVCRASLLPAGVIAAA